MIKNNTLERKIKLLKKQGKKIVLCHGVFDVVHIGHIYHFKKAKSYGNYLIVSITSSKFIKKGPGRPIFNDAQRLEFIKNIECVDQVIISNNISAEDVIKIVKPNIYAKGPDYKSNKDDKTKKIFLENKLVKKFNGIIKYTDDFTFSSSKLINSGDFIFNNDQKKFINNIKNKYSYKDIFNILESFKKLKVLVLGELIIDKYTFGSAVGKSSKEPHLVFNKKREEYYVGGTGAIARHLNSFVNKIDLVCSLGYEKFYKKLIKKNFTNNITSHFLKEKNYTNTIVKERFVDEVSGYKLFGSYTLPLASSLLIENKILKKIDSLSKKSDLIIIADYGHHFLSKNIAKKIISNKNFVTVNAQINSATQGYNSVKKYAGVNAIIINEAELRQEIRDNVSDIKFLAKKYKKEKKINHLIVTMGKNGAILVDNFLKTYSCPAFAQKTIDKVGSGDAMLSMMSLCLKLKVDPILILFLGSIVASHSLETLGNKKSINFEDLDRSIEFMLK